jgi:hypothetical protein
MRLSTIWVICSIRSLKRVIASTDFALDAKSTQSRLTRCDMEGGNSVSQHICRDIRRPAAKLLALLPVAVFFLVAAGDGVAFERRAGSMPERQAAARPSAPNFGRGANPFSRGGIPFARGPGEQHSIQGRPNETLRSNEALRNEASLDHRNPAGDLSHGPGAGGFRNGGPIGGFRGGPGSPRSGGGPGGLRGGGPGGLGNHPLPGFARNGLPRRPFPGETGFTGVPPRGETRFIPSGVAPQTVDAAARRLGLVAVSSQSLTLSGGTLFHFRIDDGRPVSDAVRDLEAENIGVAQPNYVYHLQQDAHAPASLAPAPALPQGDPAQYVLRKLRLAEVHKIATGAKVLVAVIDSQVDTAHPDLNGTIAGQFDAAKSRDRPDEHGTERRAPSSPTATCSASRRAPASSRSMRSARIRRPRRRRRPSTFSPASNGQSPRARASST